MHAEKNLIYGMYVRYKETATDLMLKFLQLLLQNLCRQIQFLLSTFYERQECFLIELLICRLLLCLKKVITHALLYWCSQHIREAILPNFKKILVLVWCILWWSVLPVCFGRLLQSFPSRSTWSLCVCLCVGAERSCVVSVCPANSWPGLLRCLFPISLSPTKQLKYIYMSQYNSIHGIDNKFLFTSNL